MLNFLNQKEKQFECNVCFEEYGRWKRDSNGSGQYCNICDFRVCLKCYKKAIKNNMTGQCFGCRKVQPNQYIMIE